MQQKYFYGRLNTEVRTKMIDPFKKISESDKEKLFKNLDLGGWSFQPDNQRIRFTG